MEGIALRGDDRELLVVQERSKSVMLVDLSSRSERSPRPLSVMTNYDTIAHHFPDPPDNNGLEGITVNTRNNHVVVLKERQPGLLIELDPTPTAILSKRVMQPSQGFMHPELKAEKLDFSDLSYDSSSDTFWIFSDKGRCLFQYDWAGDTLLQRLDLTISTGDKPKLIGKPEGVAIDPGRRKM